MLLCYQYAFVSTAPQPPAANGAGIIAVPRPQAQGRGVLSAFGGLCEGCAATAHGGWQCSAVPPCFGALRLGVLGGPAGLSRPGRGGKAVERAAVPRLFRCGVPADLGGFSVTIASHRAVTLLTIGHFSGTNQGLTGHFLGSRHSTSDTFRAPIRHFSGTFWAVGIRHQALFGHLLLCGVPVSSARVGHARHSFVLGLRTATIAGVSVTSVSCVHPSASLPRLIGRLQGLFGRSCRQLADEVTPYISLFSAQK